MDEVIDNNCEQFWFALEEGCDNLIKVDQSVQVDQLVQVVVDDKDKVIDDLRKKIDELSAKLTKVEAINKKLLEIVNLSSV